MSTRASPRAHRPPPQPIHILPLGALCPGENGGTRHKALSFVDDVAWLAESRGENVLSATLEAAAAADQRWVNRTRSPST